MIEIGTYVCVYLRLTISVDESEGGKNFALDERWNGIRTSFLALFAAAAAKRGFIDVSMSRAFRLVVVVTTTDACIRGSRIILLSWSSRGMAMVGVSRVEVESSQMIIHPSSKNACCPPSCFDPGQAGEKTGRRGRVERSGRARRQTDSRGTGSTCDARRFNSHSHGRILLNKGVVGNDARIVHDVVGGGELRCCELLFPR